MTLMSGGSLGGFLRSHSIAFEETIVAWLIECLSGLDHLIRLNILHSDIKPDNLLLDSLNRLKIGDLGLMEKIPLSTATIIDVRGSPEYLPSETLLKLKKTEKMGVWSVGVTFFEVITGKLPWYVNETARATDERTKTTLAGHAQLRANGLPALRASFFIPSLELEDVLEQMIVLPEPQRATATQVLALPYIVQFSTSRLAALTRKLYLPVDLTSPSLAPPNPVQLNEEHYQLKAEHEQLKVERDLLVAKLEKKKEKVAVAAVCVDELRNTATQNAATITRLLTENDLVYIFFIVTFGFSYVLFYFYFLSSLIV